MLYIFLYVYIKENNTNWNVEIDLAQNMCMTCCLHKMRVQNGEN